jgi:peptidoglycan hydrolase-like protein with peptidoglycan-binding domain
MKLLVLPLAALLAPACEKTEDKAQEVRAKAEEAKERAAPSAPVEAPEVAPTERRAPVAGREEVLVQTDRGTAPLDDRGLIEELETALDERGFDAGAIDGKVDAALIAALEEFQRKNGLTANGRIDQATADALRLDWGRMANEAEREEEPGLEEDALEEAGESIRETGEEAGERAKEKIHNAAEEIRDKTE